MSASLVVVLAEDKRTQNLAWHLLKRLGYRRRQVKPWALPAGQGAGDAFVRQEYPKALDAVRKRDARTLLLTHIDADTNTVQARLLDLNANEKDDQLYYWIAKRNIDTWIWWLREGGDVGEEHDYKPEVNRLQGPERGAAERFFDLFRPNAAMPAGCPPSLERALHRPPPPRP